MGRAPCCEKQGLKKGPWTPNEDKLLVDYIQANGHGSWRSLPKLAGLFRCGKSCRLRWTNYLRPDIKRGPFTSDEEKSIIQLHGIVGNKWSVIAAQLPGRTDNEIKNYWNTHLKKRLLRIGLGPTATGTLHMAQWESARLEAEARLSLESLTTTVSINADTTTIVTECSSLSAKAEADDFFLRMWNSEVGDSFRKQKKVETKVEEEEVVDSYKSCVTIGEQQLPKVLEEFSWCEETSDETYQMYLNFAAADELCGFGEAGFTSLFSGDLQLEVAALDTH